MVSGIPLLQRMNQRLAYMAMIALASALRPEIGEAQQLTHRLSEASFAELASRCAPSVGPSTLRGLAKRESALRVFAIGVDDRSPFRLSRQPVSLDEATAAAAALDRAGVTYSVGVAQIHIANVRRYGLQLHQAFTPCVNLQLAAQILGDCYARTSSRAIDPQHRLQLALSCYNAGNWSTGFRNGYVAGVVTLATQP